MRLRQSRDRTPAAFHRRPGAAAAPQAHLPTRAACRSAQARCGAKAGSSAGQGERVRTGARSCLTERPVELCAPAHGPRPCPSAIVLTACSAAALCLVAGLRSNQHAETASSIPGPAYSLRAQRKAIKQQSIPGCPVVRTGAALPSAGRLASSLAGCRRGACGLCCLAHAPHLDAHGCYAGYEGTDALFSSSPQQTDGAGQHLSSGCRLVALCLVAWTAGALVTGAGVPCCEDCAVDFRKHFEAGALQRVR